MKQSIYLTVIYDGAHFSHFCNFAAFFQIVVACLSIRKYFLRSANIFTTVDTNDATALAGTVHVITGAAK